MADGRHLGKIEKSPYLSYWPIATKFGMMTWFDPLSLSAVTISKFLKSKMAAAAILKNRKIAISQQRFG